MTNRGDAAAATRFLFGRIAATPRLRLGHSVETSITPQVLAALDALAERGEAVADAAGLDGAALVARVDALCGGAVPYEPSWRRTYPRPRRNLPH